MYIEINDISEIHQAARRFLSEMGNNKIFAFYGEMGAGKTTFIKAVCEEMGVCEIVTSPTFAIINEYHTDKGEVVYHFDFYRINKLEEVFDFGCEDYFIAEMCVLLNGRNWSNLSSPDTVKISITETENVGKVVNSI